MNPLHRRTLLTVPSLGAAALGAGATGLAGAGAAPLPSGPSGGRGDAQRRRQDRRMRRWAQDTWHCLDAMTVPGTGLVSDAVEASLRGYSRHTSPTNIGGLLWSTLVARELGFLSADEASTRIARTLTSLEGMERHDPSGMYVNWYDEVDGSIVRSWPGTGAVVVPFVSSVDMGWLGAALHLVSQADPANASRAGALFEAMRWDVFYDEDVDAA